MTTDADWLPQGRQAAPARGDIGKALAARAVPAEAIVKTANPVGEAIVWYVADEGEFSTTVLPTYRILCFIPSDGV